MFWNGRTVLVAGATGLIGSHAAEALLARGARVVGTLHRSPPLIADPRLEYRRVDLTTVDGCAEATRGCDTLIIAAADTSGAAVMRSNPVVHVTENGVLNSRLLEAAWRAKVERVLFVSTTTVYADVPHAVREEEGFVGDPHPVYFGVGWMKRYVEKLCAFYRLKFGMKIAILRPTNVYGPRDKFDFERGHVLPALIRRASELEPGQPLEVWGDGTAVRDFVYVSDMTDAILAALERAADGEPINIGSGRPVTIRESVATILRLTGREGVRVLFDAGKPTSIQKRVVDLTAARARLGFEARVGFEEGLRRTIDWYQRSERRPT